MNKYSFFPVLIHFALIMTACTQGVENPSPETPAPAAITPATNLPTRTPEPAQTPLPQIVDSATPQNGPGENPGSVQECPGAPAILLKVDDWARVSVDPPQSNRLRSQPNTGSEITGQVGPGENVLVQEGPQCANGYTWWKVRSLDGQEGWTVEGDNAGYWLVEPISPWNKLPLPLQPKGTRLYDLREIRISPDTALIREIDVQYYPLATPLPTPVNPETEPWPDDPRGDISSGFTAAHAEHSSYTLRGAIQGAIQVFDRQDPLNRYYLNQQTYDDCVRALERVLTRGNLEKGLFQPFCGSMGAIPFEIAAVKPIQFEGGQGVRFLVLSGNDIVYGAPSYFFQGISEDGRYYIFAGNLAGLSHPYIVGYNQLEHQSLGPLLAWGEDESKAMDSYQVFNDRLIELMDAGEVMFYPDPALIDAMFSSIEIK